MKILHIADVHLGASNRKLSIQMQKVLKTENGSRLKQAFDYAVNIGAGAIVIAGDLFHSKNPSVQLIKFFIDIVKSTNLPVFYVKGNHDEEFLFSDALPQNLYIFSNKFESFSIGEEVNICGQSGRANVPLLDEKAFNILLLHGDVHSIAADYIDLSGLKSKNIGYLALGHLHSYEAGKLDYGYYVYPGCLTSTGFDECGDKGFVVIDTDTRSFYFQALPGRKFDSVDVDITGFNSFDDLVKKIEKSLTVYSEEDFIRVVLCGQFEDGQDKYLSMLTNHFSKRYAYFEIVDESKIKIDLVKLQQESLSFKSEFLRLVSLDDSLSEQDKTTICEFGINALRGDQP